MTSGFTFLKFYSGQNTLQEDPRKVCVCFFIGKFVSELVRTNINYGGFTSCAVLSVDILDKT